MRTLWIAGLGAVLIAGGATAQGLTPAPGTAMDPQGGAMPGHATPGQTQDTLRPGTPGMAQPGQTLGAQDPLLSQDRFQTQQTPQSPALTPPAMQHGGTQPLPGTAGQAQDPLLQDRQVGDQRAPAQQGIGTGPGQAESPRQAQQAQPRQAQPRQAQPRQAQPRQAQRARTQATGPDGFGRDDAPQRPEDRAYMGGGLILEDGQPVPLPGDPPGAAADFRAERVEQSTARQTGADTMDQGAMGHTGMGQTGMTPGTMGQSGMDQPQAHGGQAPIGR